MNKSIWLWILLLLAWIIFASFVCKRYLCGAALPVKENVEKVIPATSSYDAPPDWSYNDGTAHSIKVSDHFTFTNSGFEHLDPVSSELSAALQSTADYLKANPSRSLTVTGYYKTDEANESILPDLGLARANSASNYLASLGAPTSQLLTNSALLTQNWFLGPILKKGVDFSFGTLAKTDDRLAAIKERLFGKPISLYFATNEDNIDLSVQQRTDFADLIYYLNNVSSSNLSVSGHTDNTGDRSHNIQLSKDRADFASSYLTRNGGINTSRLNTSGMGSDKPIGDNSTGQGRARNRRVEVTLN